MTAHERIEAAIAARSQATPGPFEVVFRGTLGMYSVRKTDGSVHKQLAYCGFFDASLFAAAPDLVDEVILLRKWQQEALPYLHREIEQCKNVLGIGICECEKCTAAKIRGKQINRLIAEAQEE